MTKNHRCSIWIAINVESERSTISENYLFGQVALLKRKKNGSGVKQAVGIDLIPGYEPFSLISYNYY